MNAETLLLGLGRVSGESAVIVLAIIAIQRATGRSLAPQWRAALWLLLFARLTVPVSLPASFSAYNLIWHAGSRGPRPALAAPDESQFSNGGLNARALAATAPLPPAFPWTQAAVLVWIGGACVFAGGLVLSAFRLRRRLGVLVRVDDATVRERVATAGDLFGIHHEIVLAETDGISGPAVFGLWRPRLLVPRGWTDRFSPEEQRFVFLHEMAHLRRLDLPVAALGAAIQAIYWFNPFVWWGLRRWRMDREIACDAAALEAAGTGCSRAYGETLLRLLDTSPTPATFSELAGIAEDRAMWRNRIKEVAHFRSYSRWSIAGAFLLAAMALFCLTDAKSQLGNPTSGSLTITVQNSGAIQVNGATVTDDELAAGLTTARAANPQASVFIRSGSQAEMGRLKFVMDACRQTGFVRFELETDDAMSSHGRPAVSIDFFEASMTPREGFGAQTLAVAPGRSEKAQTVYVAKTRDLSLDDIAGVGGVYDRSKRAAMRIRWSPEGQARFQALTTNRSAGGKMSYEAIFVNGQLVACPIIKMPISASMAMITGVDLEPEIDKILKSLPSEKRD